MIVRVKRNSVTIEGYVNVVERDSEVLYDGQSSFIERIKQGAFAKSLRRRENVRVLLNHDEDHEVASVVEGTAKLKEDAVGLWCHAKIKDDEVIRLAKEDKLVGWSFGFISLNDREIWTDEKVRHREVLDLDLREVSILDDTKVPAYPATCIMTRSLEDGSEESVEYRSLEDGVEIREEENANPGGDADKSDAKSEEAGNPAEVNYHYHNRLKMAGIRK